MNTEQLKSKIDRLKGRRQAIREQVKVVKQDIRECQTDLENHSAARAIVSEATILAQTQFKNEVENLVTSAIRGVFNRKLSFIMDIKKKRNKTECTPLIQEGEHIYSPKDEMGGGIVDLISITLKFIMHSLSVNPTRPFFLFDEPLKFIGDGELLNKANILLKSLVKKLGIQLLIITHETQLAEICDKAYRVTYVNGKSVVQNLTPTRLRRRRKR